MIIIIFYYQITTHALHFSAGDQLNILAQGVQSSLLRIGSRYRLLRLATTSIAGLRKVYARAIRPDTYIYIYTHLHAAFSVPDEKEGATYIAGAAAVKSLDVFSRYARRGQT